MHDFDVAVDESEGTITINNITSKNLPGEVISIPEDNVLRTLYISLFLHRGDIKTAKSFLNEISAEHNLAINESLFVSALVYFFRCFQKCEKRIELRLEDIVLLDEITRKDFQHYKNIRNKHYAHDQNNMTQTYDFLLFTSIHGEGYDQLEACVVYHRVLPDFQYHANRMMSLIDQVLPSIEIQIDKVGKEIYNNYKDLPFVDIMNFKKREPRFANMKDVFSKRID